MLQRIRIGRHQRGLVHRKTEGSREYLRFLGPGVHWVWGLGREVDLVDLESQLELGGEALATYLEDEVLRGEVVVADLADDERGLVWVDGRLHALIGPWQRALWTGLRRVRLEVFQAAELRFSHPLLERIRRVDREGLLEVHEVPAGHHGLLYVDNRFSEELGPGRYAFWKGLAQVRVQAVDLREQTLVVAGQEILSADKVSLRLTLSAAYTVTDARRSVESTTQLGAVLYRDLQLALRRAIGTRSLDELLADKDLVSREVREAVAPRARDLGIAWGELGVRDVILPGEMKTLLNQVIEAEKRAKANLIQRREETAATRSLLNTARLIESSPTLLRLKELETAERIAASIDSIQVLGGGVQDLVRQLVPER